MPGIAPGYNDRGVRLAANNHAAQRYFDGEDPTTAGSVFNAVIQDAGLPNVDADANDLILVNSFNEWHEDTQIEASAVSGFTNVDDSASGSDYTQEKFYEGYGAKYLDILSTTTGGPAQYPIYNGVLGDINQDGTLDASDANSFRSVWATEYSGITASRNCGPMAIGIWIIHGSHGCPSASIRTAGRGHDVPLEQLVPSSWKMVVSRLRISMRRTVVTPLPVAGRFPITGLEFRRNFREFRDPTGWPLRGRHAGRQSSCLSRATTRACTRRPTTRFERATNLHCNLPGPITRAVPRSRRRFTILTVRPHRHGDHHVDAERRDESPFSDSLEHLFAVGLCRRFPGGHRRAKSASSSIH